MSGQRKIAETHPQIVAEWDQENIHLANILTHGSHIIIKWTCKICAYKWSAPIYRRCNRSNPSGCLNCFQRSRTAWNRLSYDEILTRFSSIHGDRYKYDFQVYTGMGQKIKILCQDHGWFNQTVQKHIIGRGCPSCGVISQKITRLKSINTFIEQAKLKHGENFDYSKSEYLGAHKAITIVCSKHGAFNTTPTNHLDGPGACTLCSNNVSFSETELFDLFGIAKCFRNKKLLINNVRVFPDVHIPEINLIIEYDGDYFHGNPSKYNPKNVNRSTKCSFDELYQKTLNKRNMYVKNGFRFINIWESEFLNAKKSAKQNQLLSNLDIRFDRHNMLSFKEEWFKNNILTVDVQKLINDVFIIRKK